MANLLLNTGIWKLGGAAKMGGSCKAWFSWKTGAYWNIWNNDSCSSGAYSASLSCIFPV